MRALFIKKMHQIRTMKQFNVRDIHDIIQFVNNYNLTISDCFYNLLFFLISCECLISTMEQSYIDIFIEKIKELSEVDE